MSFLHIISNDTFTRLYVGLGLLAPIDTCEAAEGLYAIRTGPVNFYIYRKGSDCIALDTGIREPAARRELDILGIDPNLVSGVFLSHSDFDHSGGLPVFRKAAVYFSRDEEQMITGKTARKFRFFHNKRIPQPYILLDDDEDVSVGSIKVKAIATPGHTPGSMSYLIDSSILYAGDAFTFRKGSARPVARALNMDQRATYGSIRKLAKLENVKLALTSHRGYTSDFANATADWRRAAKTYPK